MQRGKTSRLIDENEKKNPVRRVHHQLVVPFVYGTVSFWLGRKADEAHSYRWTVYVRSALGEDLSPVIKKVVFQLHPSFNNPTRSVETAPFELTETGWGEFEIGLTIYFHADASEKPLQLFHHLKLYPLDGLGVQSTKKPVVVESYDEIVFTEPSEAFVSRVYRHPSVWTNGQSNQAVPYEPSSPVVSKEPGLAQWFLNQSDDEERTAIAAARENVIKQVESIKSRLVELEMESTKLRADAAH